MPFPPNLNKYTITSNSLNFQDPYNSDSGSGIDLHSPVSMEVSVNRINPSLSPYTPKENDYLLICDFELLSDIYIDLSGSSNFKHGKVLVFKIVSNVDDTYNLILQGVDTDEITDYTFNTNMDSVMIVWDKIFGKWWIISGLGKVG